MASKRDDPDRCTAYARDVVQGRIVAGRLVRLACRRHLDDIKTGRKRGLVWDLERANHAIEFFEQFLCHSEGQFARLPFLLEPWQCFVVGSLFGWYTADGFRRFRTAYIEVGKGNGKSPIAAGIGLYGLVADGEESAEIYSAAVGKSQAGILFRDAENMVAKSPELAARVDSKVNNLAVLETLSFFRPISSEKRGLDGKRVHIALIDEVHEHRTPIVVDKMRAGTKGRRNPLIVEITNSGYDPESVCWKHHEYSREILEGAKRNQTWFAFVCGLDVCETCRKDGKSEPQDGCKRCDDWKDPRTWIKANPNLGVSIQVGYIREQVEEAIGMPSKMLIVKRLNLCIWTQRRAKRWIAVDVWDACSGAVDAAALTGRDCFGGLDLSSTTDLTAFVLVFPPREQGGEVQELCWYWCPEEGLYRRGEVDAAPYELWASQGLIVPTSGNRIDYGFIQAAINEAADRFKILEIGYDPHNATQIVTDLMGDGLTMVPIRQGPLSLSPPTKELERLIATKKYRHGGHEILRWNASNAAVEQDAQGNVKLTKSSATARIDGISATVNAIDRMTRHDNKKRKPVDLKRGISYVGG